MAKIRITQVKSGIDRTERDKRTLVALGLTKMHRTKEVEANPAMVGMINSVKHLLKVENPDDVHYYNIKNQIKVIENA